MKGKLHYLFFQKTLLGLQNIFQLDGLKSKKRTLEYEVHVRYTISIFSNQSLRFNSKRGGEVFHFIDIKHVR